MKALEDITLNLNGHIWALSRSMTKPDSSKTLTDNGGAINSVSWSGKNGNRLYPTGDATHAEVAAILRASLARWLSK